MFIVQVIALILAAPFYVVVAIAWLIYDLLKGAFDGHQS